MAAKVMQAQGLGNEKDAICPMLWSCSVFFEKYMLDGADETVEEFGPKEPVAFQVVKDSDVDVPQRP